MIILKLTKKDVIMMCMCGQRHTFSFDYGGINSKPGPFSFKDNDTIMYRFNDDGYNLGSGIVENITISSKNFADLNNISTDEMVEYLNANLMHGEAFNDFGTVLVESKVPGPTSCAEALDGYAAKAMGYNVRGGDFEHFCCGRMVLGYVPPFTPRRDYTEVIMLRRCNSCKGQPSIIRHMMDRSNDSDWDGNTSTRKAINTLAIHLKGSGWVDPDLADFYKAETDNPPEYFAEFFGQIDSIEVIKYEDILQRFNDIKSNSARKI